MAAADAKTILQRSRTAAVVGCSTHPEKDAHRIPALLQKRGFEVWPVNPSATILLGVPAVPTLADLAETPDLVVVFRPSEEAADVTRQAVEVGARAVWLQQGITSAEAEALAVEAGIDFVQDRCSGVDAQVFGVSHRA